MSGVRHIVVAFLYYAEVSILFIIMNGFCKVLRKFCAFVGPTPGQSEFLFSVDAHISAKDRLL